MAKDENGKNPNAVKVVYIIVCCSNDGDYSVLEADRLLDAMWDITTDEDCTRCSDNPRIFGGCLECNPAKKYFQDNK